MYIFCDSRLKKVFRFSFILFIWNSSLVCFSKRCDFKKYKYLKKTREHLFFTWVFKNLFNLLVSSMDFHVGPSKNWNIEFYTYEN